MHGLACPGGVIETGLCFWDRDQPVAGCPESVRFGRYPIGTGCILPRGERQNVSLTPNYF
jgi:hypothetical protein